MLVVAAILDYFFAHVDEYFVYGPAQLQWYVYDFATFYRVATIALLGLFLSYRLTYNKPLKISKWEFWIYVIYWVFSLVEYYFFMQTQYYERIGVPV